MDTGKSKEQLIRELADAQQVIANFEQHAVECKLTKEALELRLCNYEILAQATSEGIIVSENGFITEINENVSQMVGFLKSEIIGENIKAFIHPDDHPIVLPGIMSGQEHIVEYRMIRKDGSFIFVEAHGKQLALYGRNIHLTSIRDISEHKRAEEDLRKSEERFRALVTTSSQALYSMSPDWSEMRKLHSLGYFANMERPSRTWHQECIYPDDQSYVTAAINEAIRTKSFFELEYRIQRADGSTGWMFSRSVPIMDANGEIIEWFGAANDITDRKMLEEDLEWYRESMEDIIIKRTDELEERNRLLQGEILERKRVEEELRESEEKYRQVVENANEGILVTQDGLFQFVNPKTEELTGCTKEELIGQPIGKCIHHEDRDFVTERHKRRTKGENIPTSYEFRIVDRGGKTRWVEINSILILWQGKPSTLNFISDITDWKKAEEDKRKVECQLAQTQRIEALDRFAGGIAHDLNNILYPIILNTEELLAGEPLDSIRFDMLDQSLKAAYRSRDLVKKILTFSRRSEKKFAPINVTQLLTETTSFLRASLPSTIEVHNHSDARNDTIMGDSTQIQQVIMNLCQNAADALASHKGLIEVCLSNAYLGSLLAFQNIQAGEYLMLTVKDTGLGMKPDVMTRIFEPFFTTKDVGKGTGLGLSVVHGIVKSHSGIITMESTEGKGSLFTVYLPVCDEECQARSCLTDSAPTVQGKGKILLVDDEEMVLSSLQRVLTLSGYQVVAVKDGTEALELFCRKPDEFDIVITDLTMPGMTGLELSMKLLVVRPDTPVILCTGFNDAIDYHEVSSLGIKELLLKPAGMGELRKVITRALEN
jgi:PAS domain S-box-containing protein